MSDLIIQVTPEGAASIYAEKAKAYSELLKEVSIGSPKGVYPTLSDLTTANPDHQYIYVVAATGHWYYYHSVNGWTDGGVYQAATPTGFVSFNDPYTLANTYINSSGLPSGLSGYSATDFIRINTLFSTTITGKQMGGVKIVSFYNASKVYISSYSTTDGEKTLTLTKTDYPSGTVYIRCTKASTQLTATVQQPFDSFKFYTDNMHINNLVEGRAVDKSIFTYIEGKWWLGSESGGLSAVPSASTGSVRSFCTNKQKIIKGMPFMLKAINSAVCFNKTDLKIAEFDSSGIFIKFDSGSYQKTISDSKKYVYTPSATCEYIALNIRATGLDTSGTFDVSTDLPLIYVDHRITISESLSPNVIIVSASVAGAKYATIADLIANEAAGTANEIKKIYLPDKTYTHTSTNSKSYLPAYCEIYGAGMNATNIILTIGDASTVSTAIELKTGSTLRDLTITAVTPPAQTPAKLSYYCMHLDSGTIVANIANVRFRRVDTNTDPTGSANTVVGIGTWESIITFSNCIFEGKNGVNESSYVLNLHNTGGYFSRVTFDKCKFIGGSSAVNINCAYIPGPSKDLYEFTNCDIDGVLVIKNYVSSKNPFMFNFTNSKVKGIIGANTIIDTSLASYEQNSMPMPKEVEYFKNMDTVSISEGDLLSYVYSNRYGEWGDSTTIPTAVGVQKVSASNYKNFAGVALCATGVSKDLHLAVKGIVKVSGAITATAGDFLTVDATGLVVSTTPTNIKYLGSNYIKML